MSKNHQGPRSRPARGHGKGHMRRLWVAFALLMAMGCEDGGDLPGGTDARTDGGTGVEGGMDVPDAREAGMDTTTYVIDVPDRDAGIPDVPPDTGPDTVMVPEATPDMPGETGDAPPAGGGTFSHLFTAAAGGTLNAGAVRVLVPAGALAADTTITLTGAAPGATVPNRADILGDVYELSPTGTTFLVPIRVTLTLKGSVPAGREAVVAWLNAEGVQWVPAPTISENGTVTGFVTHFTSFTVLLVDQMDVCPHGGACGGSLDGTWEYRSSCIRPAPPLPESCGSGAPIHLLENLSARGTLSISAGRYTMNRMVRSLGTLYYTQDCLGALNQPQVKHATCDALQAELIRVYSIPFLCKGTLAQGCSCLLSDEQTFMEAGTVTVDGNKVTLRKDGSPQPGKSGDFCVRDHTLTFKDAEGSVYTATKMH